MTSRVYDTTVLVFSNGDLGYRRQGSAFDRRLSFVEDFLENRVEARYNDRLYTEWITHAPESRRNDVIHAFFVRLADSGVRVQRSTLSRQDYATARDAGWPSHDQHLLAAALEGTRPQICVTEEALARCAKAIRRRFRVSVVQL